MVKAISLWQPWASLVAVGAKKIETRSWSTNYRGPLAIHAAKKWNLELSSMLAMWHVQNGLAPLVGKPLDLSRELWSGVKEEHLPRGAVIAICKLVDCIPTDDLTQKQIGTDKPFGDFSLGRFGWLLEDVQLLPEPIPETGHQGLWNWTPPEGLCFEGGAN